MRRNNSFGTKSTLGIKDLIENGVIIDQTHIRFDDFIASSNQQVPLPPPGQAITVSYGTSAVQPQHRYREETTHYLEIALRAADAAPAEHPSTKPLAVNYVFVIDVSGSMGGEKLDTVKSSIRELFGRLREDDIIGIVEFNSDVRTLLKATPKRQIAPSELSRLIGGLKADGGTDLNLGLLFGMDEISRYGKPDVINNVYLFSDGNPTSGERDWMKIRQHVAERTRGNIGLSVFGFGSDANMKELDALAGLTGGKATFVAHPDDLRLNLREDLARREHLAAINIQLQIEIDEDITILHLYGHDQITDPIARDAVLQEVAVAKQQAKEQFGVQAAPDLVTQEHGIRIFAPDLAVGETYWVVFELALPAGRTKTNLGKATVQYVDTFTRTNQKHAFAVAQPGAIPSDVVTLHGLGLWTSEVAFYALEDLYQEDYETARRRIDRHIHVLESMKTYLPAPQLVDDIISLRKFVTLAQNLGKPISLNDSGSQGTKVGYTCYTLNQFGHVRNGFLRANYIAEL